MSSVSASFKMKLEGLPEYSSSMNAPQQKYFSDFTLSFIRSQYPIPTNVLAMNIEDQNYSALSNPAPGLEVIGTIQGLQFYYSESIKFAESIQNIFDNNAQTFVDKMTRDAILPSNPLVETDSIYFLEVSKVSNILVPVERHYNTSQYWHTQAPAPVSSEQSKGKVVEETGKFFGDAFDKTSDAGKNNWLIVSLIAIVICFALCCGLLWARRRRKQRMLRKPNLDGSSLDNIETGASDDGTQDNNSSRTRTLQRVDPVQSQVFQDSAISDSRGAATHSRPRSKSLDQLNGFSQPLRPPRQESARRGRKPSRSQSFDDTTRSFNPQESTLPKRSRKVVEQASSSDSSRITPLPRSYSANVAPIRTAPLRASDGVPAVSSSFRAPPLRCVSSDSLPVHSKSHSSTAPSCRIPSQRGTSEIALSRPYPRASSLDTLESPTGFNSETRYPTGVRPKPVTGLDRVSTLLPPTRLPTTRMSPIVDPNECGKFLKSQK